MIIPTISVIVPVYNTEKYLRKCVNSILKQTYTNLEILLVDDGSAKEARDLCDELASSDPRIMVIHQENSGLSAARNKGIEASSGQFITFVDSDDFISPTMYEELMSCYTKDSISISHFVRVDQFDNVYYRNDPFMVQREIRVEEYIESLLLHSGDVSVCTKLFSRELVDSIRFERGRTNEDLLFMMQIVKRINKVHFTGKVGYYYFVRSGSLSSGYGKAVIDMVENSILVKNDVINYYPQLTQQAWRFVLYQHMAYLLLVPMSHINGNSVYKNALSLMRCCFMKHGLLNSYLNFKQKVIMLGVVVTPKIVACVFQRKRNLI